MGVTPYLSKAFKQSLDDASTQGIKQGWEAFTKSVTGSPDNVINTNDFKGFMKTFDKYTGIPSLTKGVFKEDLSFGDAAKKAGYYTTKTDGSLDKLNYGKIAGGYLTASAGLRTVSGGGLYKDNQGNTNLVGVPFV